MKEKITSISSWKIAAAYIGTIVGAGFASGQEVLQFFSHFGLLSIPAILLATGLFTFFGQVILRLAHELQAESHMKVIRHAGGPLIGRAIDGVITFFLFGALTAMAAGAGAIFREQFGLPHLLGSLVMVAATMFTVLLGIAGVINAISLVVPVLLVAVLGIATAALVTAPLDAGAIAGWAAASRAPVPFWPLSAVVYVSYNLVMAVAILAPMGRLARDEGALNRGALLGGIGLGIGALAINLAFLASAPAVLGFEVPMVQVAARFSPLIQTAYSLVLLAEIYTTAVGGLYGFAVRLTSQDSPAYRWVVIGTSLAGFAAGQLGFSTLVRVLYPAVGYAGLLMLAGLLYSFMRDRYVAQPAFKRRK